MRFNLVKGTMSEDRVDDCMLYGAKVLLEAISPWENDNCVACTNS